jgi:hypothetical protein
VPTANTANPPQVLSHLDPVATGKVGNFGLNDSVRRHLPLATYTLGKCSHTAHAVHFFIDGIFGMGLPCNLLVVG